MAALRTRLEALAARDLFSGSVLLAKHGNVLFAGAYGYADHAFKVPNQVNTKFNLGSMGKMFTGVAVLQLAQQGKLSLDDTLLERVPNYPDQEIAGRITLYQLLTHTSGLGDISNSKFFATPRDQLNTIAAHLPLFTGQPLLFDPGMKWSYSNAGYIVLGLVIEQLSGQSYYDFVREHIFQPAGMPDTDNYEPDADVPNRAIGYASIRPEPKAGEPHHPVLRFPGVLPPGAPRKINTGLLQRGASAGGGYSTVEDLLHFANALQGHRLLDKEHTDLVMTGHVATTLNAAKYGFGMEEEFVNGVRIVGHGGGGPGINTNLDIYPDLGYVVAVLSNYDGGAALINPRIRGWLTGEKMLQPVHLPADRLRIFSGKYSVVPPPRPSSGGGASQGAGGSNPPAAAIMTIDSDATGLWLDSGGLHRLLPLSPAEFYDDNFPTLHFTFTFDAGGNVASFTFPGGPGGVLVTANKTDRDSSAPK